MKRLRNNKNSSNKNNNVNSKKKLKRKLMRKLEEKLKTKLRKKLKTKLRRKLKKRPRKKLKTKLRNNKNSNTKIPEEIHLRQTVLLLQQSPNKQKKKSVSLNEKQTSFLLSFSLQTAFLFRYITALIEYKNDNYSVSL